MAINSLKSTNMKKLISILSFAAIIAIVITACKSKPISVTSPVKFEDTVGLAQFQNWKVMNERAEFEEYQAWKKGEVAPVVSAPVAKTTARRSSSTSGSMTSSSTNYAKTTTKKKGWSKGAKYAAIGGGGGAVLGAVINKRNRVAGGVFGGLLGGGLGYILGHNQDKKDGRF